MTTAPDAPLGTETGDLTPIRHEPEIAGGPSTDGRQLERRQTPAERFAERERADALEPDPNRISALRMLDGALFTFAGLASFWLGYLLLVNGVRWGWQVLLLVVFWVLFTYLMLPRLHRVLTRLYVPGYFIGRARTSDGLLGDPVNLGLYAHESQIHEAMTNAGWTRADDLSFASGRKIVRSTLTRRSYSQAPVSPLLLFDRQQDFAYQQEVAGNPAKRHHVRFWRCPEGWMLPGGYPVDWLAAGTYDRAVGFSLFTFQITHKIAADTDIERDFIVDTVQEADPRVTVRVIENFSTGYHSRNGGGDLIRTDGDLPILDLRALDVEPLPAAEVTDSRQRRPSQTVFGAAVAMVRGIGFVLFGLFAILALVLIDHYAPQIEQDLQQTGLSRGDLQVVLAAAVAYGLVSGVVDIVLAVATYRGRNWARIVLMLSSVVSTMVAFVADVRGTTVVTLSTLPGIAASILVLIALSSHPAREYAEQSRARGRGRRHRQTAS